MIGWIKRWWRARQRRIDIEILWPDCTRNTPTRHYAQVAFRVHMEIDPAYKDMTDNEKTKFLENLP